MAQADTFGLQADRLLGNSESRRVLGTVLATHTATIYRHHYDAIGEKGIDRKAGREIKSDPFSFFLSNIFG